MERWVHVDRDNLERMPNLIDVHKHKERVDDEFPFNHN